MKTNTIKLAALAIMPAALLTFTSCSTTGANEQMDVVETKTGAAIVDTVSTSGTVTYIDRDTRKVTLTMAGGQRTTVTCGPEAVNFSQLQVGDQVNAVVTEELAVFLGKGSPPSAAAASGVALAPIGAKPGGMIANTVVVTARITAIDAATRKVTLALPDGTSKTVKAGKQVNLGAVNVGDDVTLQYTEAMAITVVKP